MQRPSLAHFLRELSLRHVDLPSGRYQISIMQRLSLVQQAFGRGGFRSHN
jgi:hypothetical protein